MKRKWNWRGLAKKHQQAVTTEIEADIQKLEEAIKLISEVNEPLAQAYWKRVGNPNSPQESTGVNTGSAAMKLQRCISELKLVKGVMITIKDWGF